MFKLGKLIRIGSVIAWILHLVACMGTVAAGSCDRLFTCELAYMVMLPGHYFARGRPISTSSGCIGCPVKTKLTSSADRSVKPQFPDAPAASREVNPGLSETFWTPSTCDMDNSTVQSRGSISSYSTSIQMHDTHAVGNSNANTEFVNHGLILWSQARQRWIGSRKPQKSVVQQFREPKLSWNATYESLLGSNEPFPKPVPLSEMVDFLVDIWEQEGMYD